MNRILFGLLLLATYIAFVATSHTGNPVLAPIISFEEKADGALIKTTGEYLDPAVVGLCIINLLMFAYEHVILWFFITFAFTYFYIWNNTGSESSVLLDTSAKPSTEKEEEKDVNNVEANSADSDAKTPTKPAVSKKKPTFAIRAVQLSVLYTQISCSVAIVNILADWIIKWMFTNSYTIVSSLSNTIVGICVWYSCKDITNVTNTKEIVKKSHVLAFIVVYIGMSLLKRIVLWVSEKIQHKRQEE